METTMRCTCGHDLDAHSSSGCGDQRDGRLRRCVCRLDPWAALLARRDRDALERERLPKAS